MNCQFLPIVALSILGLLVPRKGGRIFLLCLAANIFSFGLAFYWDLVEPYDLKSFGSMSFLSVCLFLFLLPLRGLDLRQSVFCHPLPTRVKLLSYGAALLTVPASLYFLQYVNRIFATDISALRVEWKMSGGTSDAGLVHRIFLTCAYLYVVDLALFVYAFVRKCIPSWLMCLLLVGSISYPLSGIYLYSRQMTITYGVTFFVIVMLASGFCSLAFRRRLTFGLLIVGLLGAVPLAYITIERFADNGRQGFFEYLGGGPRFFSRIYYHGDEWAKDPTTVFLRPYSLAWKFVGKDAGGALEHDMSTYEQNRELTYTAEEIDQPSAPFVTFCGGWLAEFPRCVVIVVHMAICCLAMWWVRRCRVEISLPGLMVCAVYVVSGLLYPIGYMYAGTPGNVVLTLIFAMAVFLGLEHKRIKRGDP